MRYLRFLLLGVLALAALVLQAGDPPAASAETAASVDAGNAHTCAVTTAGGIKCWGRNWSGQLGDGTTTDRSTPVDVTGLTGGVAAVSAGSYHTCALTTAGGLKCWGNNEGGQLGDGTTTNRTTPVDVTGLTGGVAAVSAGWYYTCALTTAGGLKCWGDNGGGQLGDGTTTSRSTPVDVTGLTGGVAAVSAGGDHTCALTTAGGLKCWGGNNNGQLGDGTTTGRTTPVDVAGLTGGVAAVSVGGGHTCALTTAGGLKCWGWNLYGQLGDGTTTNHATPVDVTGLSSGVAAVAAGDWHTCALTTAGGRKCWGHNVYGQLGDGTTTDRLAPVDVTGLTGGVAAVAVGGDHTCALMTTGGLKCWGSKFWGQLGDGTMGYSTAPVDVTGLTSGVAAVSAGWLHTCALTTAGGLLCWGENHHGELGDGTTTDRLTPVDVTGLSSGVAAVSAGGSHTCAVTTAGGLKCWGDNSNGQLGDGTTTGRTTPVDVTGLSSGVAAVAAGGGHTCALTTAGALKCWGYNYWGQLGDGTTTDRLTPVDVTGLSSGVAAVSSGGGHTCALTTAGGLKCWGENDLGQLGDGTTTDRLTPVDVTGLTSGVGAVSAGGGHTCALTTAGALKCWGYNYNGQLGDGTTTDRLTPVNVSGLTSGVAAVSAGGNHTCALTTAGGVKCWGYNYYALLGDGTTTDRLTPVDVTGLTSGVAAVSAGLMHTCALTTGGGVKCWGAKNHGQLGDGSTAFSATPVDVVGFDSDGDGVPDERDNCPDTANPGQENNDGDSMGDVCDPNDDNDNWPDADDNCPFVATPWFVPPGDGDCDGFTTPDEGTIGTDAADACPDNPSDDAWPCDFDMNRVVNISDVFRVLPPYFGRTSAHPEWDPRRDLAPDGVINISDVFKVLPPYFGASCTP